MDKKNYSIIVAIALIALLVVAMICMGCEKKNNGDVLDNGEQIEMNSGDEIQEIPNIPNVNENIEWTEDGTKVNVSEKINKEKMTFGDVDFTDIKFEFFNGVTAFKANIKNNSNKDYPLGMEMKIFFYDKEKNLIAETYALTNTLLANGESNIDVQILSDCSYADSIEVKIIE
jgi:hypothetical protein